MPHAATPAPSLTDREISLFRVLFVVSALWNFAGSGPGLVDPAGMFAREFGHALTDPVMVAVYRGAWATSFIYAFGFLLAARNPERHYGIVLMGGIGKFLFALNLLVMHLNGWTSSFALLVIGGDFVFVSLFVLYLARLRRNGGRLL